MINSTDVSYFILAAFFDTGHFKYLYFLFVLCLYVLILAANVLLIVVICMNRSLHEPMYLFLCSLFVNELYGSTGLFPFLLHHILSDVHTVSFSSCLLQIFCIYTYASIQFCNLTIMSYDRYLAICCPLQYNTRMTSQRVAALICLSWLCPFLGKSVLTSLIIPLQLCGNIINRVFCDNYSIMKLACSDITPNYVYGVLYMASLVVMFLLIIYSYMRILRVCFSGSKQTRQKAISTCVPHLASLLNFSCSNLFELRKQDFGMKPVPNELLIFFSLYWLTCPPLFNPVMYGLHITKIRITCKHLLFGKM